MPAVVDLEALTKRAEFAAREADVADESAAGLKRHVANLRAAAERAEDALAEAVEHATAKRTAADEAAEALEAANAEGVFAVAGTATGSASAG